MRHVDVVSEMGSFTPAPAARTSPVSLPGPALSPRSRLHHCIVTPALTVTEVGGQCPSSLLCIPGFYTPRPVLPSERGFQRAPRKGNSFPAAPSLAEERERAAPGWKPSSVWGRRAHADPRCRPSGAASECFPLPPSGEGCPGAPPPFRKPGLGAAAALLTQVQSPLPGVSLGLVGRFARTLEKERFHLSQRVSLTSCGKMVMSGFVVMVLNLTPLCRPENAALG